MTKTKPTYEELEAQLAEATAKIEELEAELEEANELISNLRAKNRAQWQQINKMAAGKWITVER